MTKYKYKIGDIVCIIEEKLMGSISVSPDYPEGVTISGFGKVLLIGLYLLKIEIIRIPSRDILNDSKDSKAKWINRRNVRFLMKPAKNTLIDWKELLALTKLKYEDIE